MKVQGGAASYPEDPANVINEGGYTKNQIIKVAEATFYVEDAIHRLHR